MYKVSGSLLSFTTMDDFVAQVIKSDSTLISKELLNTKLNQKSIKVVLDLFIKSIFLKQSSLNIENIKLFDDSIENIVLLINTKSTKKIFSIEKKLDSIFRNILRVIFSELKTSMSSKPLMIYAQNEIIKNSDIAKVLFQTFYSIDDSLLEQKKQKSQNLFALAGVQDKSHKESNLNKKSKKSQTEIYQDILDQMKSELIMILNKLKSYKKRNSLKTDIDIDKKIKYLTGKVKEIDKLLLQIG